MPHDRWWVTVLEVAILADSAVEAVSGSGWWFAAWWAVITLVNNALRWGPAVRRATAGGG